MPYSVALLHQAVKDLKAIQESLEAHAGRKTAYKEINRIEIIYKTLSHNPERGSVSREILRTGIRDYRQLIAAPYRIIYQVIDNTVYIFGIIHGNRNVHAVLRQRLFIPDR